jgi:hypothetical protein
MRDNLRRSMLKVHAMHGVDGRAAFMKTLRYVFDFNHAGQT